VSRAFMKEEEAREPGCPSCGSPGAPVSAVTLEAQLSTAERAALEGRVFHCPSPRCATAYFTALGASVPASQLSSPAWPKSPDAPICPCFGVRADDLVSDAKVGRKDRIKSLRERAEGPEAVCARRSPDGTCCVPRAMQLFREHFTS
jgi:hypothetical protein